MNWIDVGPIAHDHEAKPWEHVFVNFNVAPPGDITITLPKPDGHMPGKRVRVTDISADGGAGNGAALRVAGEFYPVPNGYYAASGYVVANNTLDQSRRGANAEFVCIAEGGKIGWVIAQEGCQPMSQTGTSWLSSLFRPLTNRLVFWLRRGR